MNENTQYLRESSESNFLQWAGLFVACAGLLATILLGILNLALMSSSPAEELVLKPELSRRLKPLVSLILPISPVADVKVSHSETNCDCDLGFEPDYDEISDHQGIYGPSSAGGSTFGIVGLQSPVGSSRGTSGNTPHDSSR